MGISEYATAEERHAIFHGEPVVELPAPEPEVEDDDEEDVPVSRSAALIEEALNAKKK